jgi:hypothetical protein
VGLGDGGVNAGGWCGRSRGLAWRPDHSYTCRMASWTEVSVASLTASTKRRMMTATSRQESWQEKGAVG